MKLTIWTPPKRNSIYATAIYLNCHRCSAGIDPGTIMGIDDNALTQLANDETPFYPKCLKCAMKEILQWPEVIATMHDIVREELRKIIKEEVHDPNGAFSPKPEDF